MLAAAPNPPVPIRRIRLCGRLSVWLSFSVIEYRVRAGETTPGATGRLRQSHHYSRPDSPHCQ